jgi:SAM-dependent methyltransferase
MHGPAFGWVARTLKDVPPRRAVVEVGARDLNGSVRQLFMGATYVGIDVQDGVGVDVVADGATYEPPFVPDTVVCCEVLEHAENAPEIVQNAFRMLAPGGLFLMTCATDPRAPHSADDGGPVRPGEFYRNVSFEEFQRWAQVDTEFLIERFEIDQEAGDLRVLARKPDGTEPDLYRMAIERRGA